MRTTYKYDNFDRSFVQHTNWLLRRFERAVNTPQLPAPDNHKDVKHDTSINDSQNFKHKTSTQDSQNVEERTTMHDSQNAKKQTSTSNSQDMKNKTLTCNSENVESPQISKAISDILMSLYDKPKQYLIVEDVEKLTKRYCASSEKGTYNDNFYSQFKRSESNVFANYREMSVEKKEKAEMKYFCKFPICRTEIDDCGTIYYLNRSFQCLLCCRELTASFNILEESKTLMIDESENDYLLPYQQGNIAGLVHRRCKTQENLSYNVNNHYRCNLSSEKQLRQPVDMQYQLCMLTVIVTLMLSPIFLNFLIYNLSDDGIFQHVIWIIILYYTLFITLAVSELFRYYKTISDIVEITYLMVWKDQSNLFSVKNFN